MKIGIIGYGFVGKATGLLKCEEVEILIYDIEPKLCNCKFEELKFCDIIFISVPTPMNEDGSCHIGIVKKVVSDLQKLIMNTSENPIIIIRSTVPPGTCEILNNNIWFMPEFLTEKRFMIDFITNDEWIIGSPTYSKERIPTHKETKQYNTLRNLFKLSKKYGSIANDKVRFTTTRNAELVKYTRNSFLATKISFFNEISEICKKSNCDFETVRELTCNDTRIGHSHSNVPGHDGKNGFGGICLPKDSSALLEFGKNYNAQVLILDAIKNRNNNIDRIEQDWKTPGRSII